MAMMFCRGCGKEIHESAPVCPHCGAPQGVSAPAVAPGTVSLKSQTVAGLLCAFLGGLGAHKFYLGRITAGVLYLLFCWTGIPGLIALVDLVSIAFGSQENWAKKHNHGTLTPPVHVVVKIIVLIFPAIMVIGILAAIALPAYQDYTLKAKTASAIVALNPAKTLAAGYSASKGGALLDEATLQQIKSSVSASKEITEVDAFAYKKYADIVANLSVGTLSGTLSYVSNDSGATWACGFNGLPRKYVPNDCVESAGVTRPEIDRPKLGLWDLDYANATLQSCTTASAEKGDPNAAANCRCLVDKVAQVIAQSDMNESLSEGQQQIVQQAREACAQAPAL